MIVMFMFTFMFTYKDSGGTQCANTGFMTSLQQELKSGMIYPHELFSCLYESYRDKFIEVICGGGSSTIMGFWNAVRGWAA